MNVLELESSCSRLPSYSFATVCICAFPYMSFPQAYYIVLDCGLSSTALIIFLSTRYVTFFGLPADPFKTSRPSFSARNMRLYC